MAACDAAALGPHERRVRAPWAWADEVMRWRLAMPPLSSHVSAECMRYRNGPSPCDIGVRCRLEISPSCVGASSACAISMGRAHAMAACDAASHSARVSVECMRDQHGPSPCDGSVRCRLALLM